MARLRQGSISETLQFLRHLEGHYKGRPEEVRVRILRLMKENPGSSLHQIAIEAGCTERTVGRWWREYRAGGLAAVVPENTSRSTVPVRAGRKQLEELGRKIQRRELSSLGDIRRWLKDEHNVEYTLPGVSQLVRRELNVVRGWSAPPAQTRSAGVDRYADSAPPFSGSALRFLNSLPITGSLPERVDGFRNALRHIFGDVDRVSINVNFAFNLSNPESYDPDTIIRQHAQRDIDWSQSFVVTSETVEGNSALRIVEELRAKGMPVDSFHHPFFRNYNFNEQAYVGTVFLWRDRAKEPICERSIQTLLSLDPFIYFLLFDLIAHHQATKPVDLAFRDSLTSLTREAGLTLQERRIVIHQLLGCSYKEIADLLEISLSTLKSHMATIHQKTGTRSQGELFGKYFTPKLRGAFDTINNDLPV